ncbi:MAG TPA: helix-turn-helix transcriptional regulator [Pyrinomonadaceae bacterium]|nr:helix-turn-helix transcriptional regulator [Pyrinomonadaceae bacterium]
MLYLNVKRMMRLRGIDQHYHLMLKLGFVPSTARAFLSGEITLIKLEQIEKLCVALNCTPNDLLAWQPDASQAVSETHSMNNLKRSADKDLPKLLSEIPSDKFEQILDILQDLKDKP